MLQLSSALDDRIFITATLRRLLTNTNVCKIVSSQGWL
jgi:hypothetical protein